MKNTPKPQTAEGEQPGAPLPSTSSSSSQRSKLATWPLSLLKRGFSWLLKFHNAKPGIRGARCWVLLGKMKQQKKTSWVSYLVEKIMVKSCSTSWLWRIWGCSEVSIIGCAGFSCHSSNLEALHNKLLIWRLKKLDPLLSTFTITYYTTTC